MANYFPTKDADFIAGLANFSLLLMLILPLSDLLLAILTLNGVKWKNPIKHLDTSFRSE